MNDQSRPALATGVRLQTDKVNGEPVLVFPEGVLFLNSTAHEVVTRCSGQATVAEIISLLAEEYDATPEALRNDVLECLAQLHQRKLIALAP